MKVGEGSYLPKPDPRTIIYCVCIYVSSYVIHYIRHNIYMKLEVSMIKPSQNILVKS